MKTKDKLKEIITKYEDATRGPIWVCWGSYWILNLKTTQVILGETENKLKNNKRRYYIEGSLLSEKEFFYCQTICEAKTIAETKIKTILLTALKCL